jgi:hypothetical protein
VALPDGTPLVGIVIAYGPVTTQYVMTAETAEELRPLLDKLLTDGVTAARRAKSGLVVASVDVLGTLARVACQLPRRTFGDHARPSISFAERLENHIAD